MNVDVAQQQKVITWLQQGATLAEVQRRLEAEFGLRLTYREVKFLVGDLRVLPQDTEPSRTTVLPGKPSEPGAPQRETDARSPKPRETDRPAPPPPPEAGVQVSVDQLTRPDAVVSGNVTFSDGKSAAWYIDQLGRIGIAPKDKGYRPSASDMREFQMALEQELAHQGF